MMNKNLMLLSVNFFNKTRQIILKIIADYNVGGFLITNPANIFYCKEGNIEMCLVEVSPGHWVDQCCVHCGYYRFRNF